MKFKSLLVAGMICGICPNVSHAQTSENLIRNGDFNELAKDWEIGYREPELGTITFEVEHGPEGSGFVRLAPLNSAAPRYLVLQQKFSNPLVAGRYQLKAWFRISEDYAARMPRMSFGWRNPGEEGESGSASLQLDQNASPGEWILCESEVDVPEGSEGTYLFLFAYGSMGYADIGAISMERLP